MPEHEFEPEVSERDWLAGSDLWAMWRSLPTPRDFDSTDRKQLLLAVAAVRRVEGLMTDPRSRAVIPVAEAHADGLTTSEEMQAAHDAARDAADEGFVTNSAYWAAMAARKLWHDWTELGEAAGHALTAQTYQELGAVWAGREPPIGSEVFAAACRTGEERTIRLIRDIYGNPFRPVTFDPSWRTSTAVGLARSMYESRDFAAMLILADALEDAGCDSPDVLAHCRDPKGVHVRGCWVVDLVLGKC